MTSHRLLFSALLSALFLPSAAAQVSSLPGVDFARLSQHDPNPLADRALAIHPGEWKHAETEHFIYHFVHGYVATPISVEAEFHYRVVVKELQRDPPTVDTKSHIYVFERAEDWAEFQKVGGLEPWTGGIHSQGSLFIIRNPAYKFSDNSLGHEIVHLVMHRYYPDAIPRWLDEGFAQYLSGNAHASYQRARGYLSKPRSHSVAAHLFFPIATLARMSYPATTEQVEAFYDESERLVRFLSAKDKPSFLMLLDALARHQPFETAVMQCFTGRFSSLVALETEFRAYATSDDGASQVELANQ